MRRVAMIGFVLAALLASVGLVMADDGGRRFTTTLTGAAERPGPGDPDGSGTAVLRLNSGQEEICWEIEVSNITLPATAAHIHIGTAIEAGPVVVGLSAPNANGHASGCTSAA